MSHSARPTIGSGTARPIAQHAVESKGKGESHQRESTANNATGEDDGGDEDTADGERGENNAGDGCPECGGSLDTTGIETVCEACGLVVDEQPIDHGPEWRSFDDSEGRWSPRRRTGAPLTPSLHDRGLATEIGRGADGYGTPLPDRRKRQLARLRREHARARTRSSREQNLSFALGEVHRVTSALDLERSIREQACSLFRTAQNQDLCTGLSLEAVAAASVYATARLNTLPITLADVTTVARDADRVQIAYNTLNRELDLPAQPIQPRAYLPRLASELDVPETVRQRAATLLTEASVHDQTIGGSNPIGVAAGCLYAAVQECSAAVTQTAISDAADVSPPTIRRCRDDLVDADLSTA